MQTQRPEIRKKWLKIWGLATLYNSQINHCNYFGSSQDQANSTVNNNSTFKGNWGSMRQKRGEIGFEAYKIQECYF